MEFMGIGPLELLLILVIALVVFGPHRLPEIGAQLGKFVRNMKQMGFELTRELNKELESGKKDIADAAREAKEVAKSVNILADGGKTEERSKLLVEPEVKDKKSESTPTPLG